MSEIPEMKCPYCDTLMEYRGGPSKTNSFVMACPKPGCGYQGVYYIESRLPLGELGLTEEQVRGLLERHDAFWLYPGEPRKDAPHALLTSGKHSNGYVNVGDVLKKQPAVRMAFARGMLAALRQEWFDCFDRVAGAASSSTDLAGDIARIEGASHIRMLKIEDSGEKRQVWDPENTPLRVGETIIHIEELITTASSALQVREGIRRANPGITVEFAPFLPVVVERSDPEDRVVIVDGSMVLPLLQLDIRTYEPGPATCPYCTMGSPAIKPKEGDNWLRLTGKK